MQRLHPQPARASAWHRVTQTILPARLDSQTRTVYIDSTRSGQFRTERSGRARRAARQVRVGFYWNSTGPLSSHGRRWFRERPYLGTPVPARGTACGLAPPSSTIFRDACRSPLAPGVKVTSIVQLPPAASLDRHVVVSAKSPKFAPLMPTPEICKGSLPVFVTVAVRGSLVVPTI